MNLASGSSAETEVIITCSELTTSECLANADHNLLGQGVRNARAASYSLLGSKQSGKVENTALLNADAKDLFR
jgi:hypothetical protein